MQDLRLTISLCHLFEDVFAPESMFDELPARVLSASVSYHNIMKSEWPSSVILVLHRLGAKHGHWLFLQTCDDEVNIFILIIMYDLI